ncbi:hypothetical protein [Bacillus sp. PS06]|uniref:hypothetical protein n=1 Tax=Bacillus sp. PS06 TaxID=2764176 RepID=UPI001781E290|nr:hypothetical protein [Bacillus sp. PS06]MBD8069795.1 hypothetical protein [Bacillus sp. PS06]
MTVEKILNDFLGCINKFDRVVIKPSSKNPNRRNVYVGTAKKRWIQIDISETNINICMDHDHGDLTVNDILLTGVPNERSKGKSGFDFKVDSKNFDAVHFTFYESDPFDFDRKEFLDFLEKHYRSYLKLVKFR